MRWRATRRALIAAVCAAAFLPAGVAAAQDPEPPPAAPGVAGGPEGARADGTALRLLAKAESVYSALSSLKAEFEQTIDVPLLARRRTGTGTWYQKGRGRFKMDFRDPAGDVIVADGSQLWLFYPSTHPGQAIRSAIEASPTGAEMVDLQGRIFEDARTRYEARYGGEHEVAGSPTHLIDLAPLGESPYRRVRVWIDAGSHLVRKFEITERNETVRTVVLRDLEPNAAIDDRIFRFRPPPGTDVFEG